MKIALVKLINLSANDTTSGRNDRSYGEISPAIDILYHSRSVCNIPVRKNR